MMHRSERMEGMGWAMATASHGADSAYRLSEAMAKCFQFYGHVPAQATVNRLGHEIVLGVTDSLVCRINCVGIARWLFHVEEIQHPSAPVRWSEMIGEATPANDLGEGLFKALYRPVLNVGLGFDLLGKNDVGHVLPPLFRENRK